MTVSNSATDLLIERPGGRVPADAEALLRIYAGSLPQGLSRLLGPARKLHALLAEVADWEHCLIARRRGEAVGIVGLKDASGSFVGGLAPGLRKIYGAAGARWRNRALAALEVTEPPEVLLIDGIAVRADCQRLGVGTALIHAAARHAQSLGKTALRLDADARNSRAAAFYLAHGFERTCQRKTGLAALILRVSRVDTYTLWLNRA